MTDWMSMAGWMVTPVQEPEGEELGLDEGLVVGEELGLDEGLVVGEDLGLDEGLVVGDELGLDEGLEVGDELGLDEGLEVGDELGLDEGLEVGDELGLDEGLVVGEGVTHRWPRHGLRPWGLAPALTRLAFTPMRPEAGMASAASTTKTSDAATPTIL